MVKKFLESNLPDPLYAVIGSAYSILNPYKKSRIMYPSSGCWRVISRDERYYTFKESIGRGRKTNQDSKFVRYTDEEFCPMTSDDLVVDVGAFIGEFALPASRRAQTVLAIEPDPRTFRCLSLQVASYNNIIAINKLPYNMEKTVTFKSAVDGSESSVVDVDVGEYNKIEMRSTTLDDLLTEYGVNHVDYLKMDAEGGEPEVLEGLENTQVDKLAIDVGKERGGDGTEDDVRDILQTRGYDCKVKFDQNGDPVLFARS